MNSPAWTAPALLLGIALMVAPWFLPAAPAWTDADAKVREQTWANLHAAIDRQSPAREGDSHAGHAHSESGEFADFATAKAAHDAQQARFEAAVARPKWIAFGLRTIGVLLAGAGVVGYVNSRRGSR
jgi:hypothetical protein